MKIDRSARRDCRGVSLSLVVAVSLAATAVRAPTQVDWIAAQAASPSARFAPAMAFDMGRNRLVLFGGDSTGQPLSDTWEWDGLRWVRRSTTTTMPARTGHAMAYDFGRGKVVLFGGQDRVATDLADLWEWNGTTWTQVVTASAPPGRHDHAMAMDLGRARVVVFGGDNAGILLGGMRERTLLFA